MESLISRFADYNPTKLIKKELHQGNDHGNNFILGQVQFLTFLDVWVLLTEFLGWSLSALY